MKAADDTAKPDTAKGVNAIIAAGADVKKGAGDGLFFRLRDKRAGWHLLYTSPTTGKRREAPIAWVPSDPVKESDLKAVRAAAAELRRQIAAGIDPLDAAKAAKHAKVAPVTFADAARAYLAKNDAWIPKQQAWARRRLLGLGDNPSKASLNQFVKDYLAPIRNMPVDDLTAAIIVERVLLEYWATAPVAAGKAAVMIAAVLDRPGLLRDITKLRPKSALTHRQKRTSAREVEEINDEDRHHPAAPWENLPAIWAKLMVEGSLPALAAAFALATAQRAATVAGAEWQGVEEKREIDLVERVWNIPAKRMKGRAGKRRKHAVPLNAAALAVLDRLAQGTRAGVVFPSPKGAAHVAPDSMREALQRAAGAQYTLHGTSRATFGSWTSKNMPQGLALVDPILAHAPDKTSAAYQRDLPIEAMRPVLDAYGRFLLTGALPQ